MVVLNTVIWAAVMTTLIVIMFESAYQLKQSDRKSDQDLAALIVYIGVPGVMLLGWIMMELINWIINLF